MDYEIPISPAKQNELFAAKRLAQEEKAKALNSQRAGVLITEWCKALASGQKCASVDDCYNNYAVALAKEHMQKHGWKVSTRVDYGPFHDRTLEATFTPITEK